MVAQTMRECNASAPAEAPTRVLTLETCLDDFLLASQVSGLAEDSIKSYKQQIGAYIKYTTDTLGINDPCQVTATDVRKWMRDKQLTCKPGALRSMHGFVYRFFSWLVEEGVLGKSPMANIKPPKIPLQFIKPFSSDQIKKLLALCDENRFLGLRNKTIILLFLETGVRLKEMAQMQIGDIDFDGGIIKIMGKGARERVVAIQEKTQSILLRYLLSRTDNYPNLWVTEERVPLTREGIYKVFYLLRKLAGIQNVRCSPHTFRHTSATMMFEAGAREFEVQALLGHSTLTMTRRYVASINSEKAAEAHKRFSPVEHLKL
jgi:site-specific recombinase XerD